MSPNMPPPAPMKLPYKGQPLPIDVNLLVLGNTMQPGYIPNPERERGHKLSHLTQLKPLKADLDRDMLHDKHILQSLSRPTNVDDSYYDRFERLERDCIENDTAGKEKTGRVRSAGNHRSTRSNSGISRDRKRPKSSSVTPQNRKSENFFETAMSFDDETKVNTKTNSESKTNLKTLRKSSANRSSRKERPKSASSTIGRRLRSGKKSRERSLSRKRSEASRSRSLGSASFCSSRSGKSEKRVAKKPPRARSSRSRTRRPSPRPGENNEPLHVVTNPEKKYIAARSVSSTGTRQRQTLASNRKARFGLRSAPVRRERMIEMTSVKAPLHPAYSRPDRQPSATKRPDDPISAVKETNQTLNSLSEVHTLDHALFREPRRYMSTVPKLKMVVAPTPTPLATLIRQSSTKLLMGNTKVS